LAWISDENQKEKMNNMEPVFLKKIFII